MQRMRKLKGVMAAEPFEDPRARFKYLSLLQDYQDLQKETDTAMKNMQIMKQRKVILAAEVRFLRKRYEYLTKNNTVNLRQPQIAIQPEVVNAPTTSRPKPKKRNYGPKEAPKKARVAKGKKAAPPPVFDLNCDDDMVSVPSRNPVPVFDLNQKERTQSGTRSSAMFIDLNQISRGDEEELQMNTEPSRIEDPRVNDDQLNDMKLSGCRTVGNGSGRAGKRKITWQDQVPLRV